MTPLVEIAETFSPRYERHQDDLVSIDVSGLERLLGPPRFIGEELRREAVARGMLVHVALAGTRSAAMVLALARPGLTIVDPGAPAATRSVSDASASGGGAPRVFIDVADALAPLPIRILGKIEDLRRPVLDSVESAVSVFLAWGIKTLGELAALPAADLTSRLGRSASVWQAIARGEDRGPLVPTLPDERFESSLDLEWPIEGFEPLSFVLTRLLEPLSTRLERRDRGAAILHVELRLVTRPSTSAGRGEPVEPREVHARRLELPSPIRDVRTLRTLALLDLESHPPPAAIDRVTVVIDPTPGRIVQHTLFIRAQPTPEQLSTLMARLGALMGQDRVGAPATVDSYRPGAFAMTPFATDHDNQREALRRRPVLDTREGDGPSASGAGVGPRAIEKSEAPLRRPVLDTPEGFTQALRRCRHPIPARVAVSGEHPVRVTTDRRGFIGGAVRTCAGPWRTSGDWWGQSSVGSPQSAVSDSSPANLASSVHPATGLATADCRLSTGYNRDEWDVALADGAVYRLFRDRETDRWFIDAIVD